MRHLRGAIIAAILPNEDLAKAGESVVKRVAALNIQIIS